MKRFLVGLFAGALSSGVTWALSHHAALTVAVGLVVALVIWFWNSVEVIGELIGDGVEALLGALLK